MNCQDNIPYAYVLIFFIISIGFVTRRCALVNGTSSWSSHLDYSDQCVSNIFQVLTDQVSVPHNMLQKVVWIASISSSSTNASASSSGRTFLKTLD